ncbi:MAG TPA: adenylate/guanylate cyclase domain-containing protein [Acidimicrobiales bacterium]|nr:adenylate/guanylate cyclase domain-containing protein [Acidimicrobiales bacterium]
MRTEYVTVGGGEVAYVVLDGGGPTMLFHFGIAPGILITEHPLTRPLFERLRRYRLVLMDCKGTGRSDPAPSAEAVDLARQALQVEAVAEAAGLEDFWLCGFEAGGSIALAAAASLRRRLAGLVLITPNHIPSVLPEGVRDALLEQVDLRRRGHGQSSLLDLGAPNLAGDETLRAQFASFEQAWGSRAQLALLMEGALSYDLAPYIDGVGVPTLHLSFGRYTNPAKDWFEQHFASTRRVHLPDTEFLFFLTDATDRVMDEIDEFVLGERSSEPTTRLLRAVLAVDLVSSTERLRAAGDHSWRTVLDQFETGIAREVARWRGALVKTTGDGAIATFSSASDAVRCALDVVHLANDLALDARAGVHVGDVELRAGDISGVTVHVAARLESVAAPGTVCVSRSCADAASGVRDLTFRHTGIRSLKGLSGDWETFTVAF